ncbi:MAG TPA: GMC family oxidoreductase [Bryobacteraceae bacterium]|nr:GMC family oxidoreductase [Bryobacteraceae bacterium]
MTTYESDILIIGAGISAAMLAQKLSELKPGVGITVVEAGRSIFDFENRLKYRARMMHYGENPWPGDFMEGQFAAGGISHTMAVGGQALHWGGVCNRFSVEDLRLKSLYGLYVDWPIEWDELEKFYCEAERRLGVSGEPSPFPEDKRSEPYPMKPMPLTWSLARLKEWGDKSGILFQGTPQAKNTVPYDGRAACQRCGTCDICPTGARYSPDFTFKKLIAEKKITLQDRTLVRKLILDGAKKKVIAARAMTQDGNEVEYRAKTFVVASGYTWSSHLLLLSDAANRSGQVGKYMNGHAFIQAFIELDQEILPNMNTQYGLISRQFFRCSPKDTYVRHDLRIWDWARAAPRLKDASGRILLGDEIVKDWKAKPARGAARVRAYYDIHPAENSELTLDASAKNQWGDPMPKIVHRRDAACEARYGATKAHIQGVFERLAQNDNGKILRVSEGDYLDHPAGGCRMGTDPATSVCDSYGRTHDHENLFVVGAPTLPAAGCTNGTLTFVALTLRSAGQIAKG